LEFLVDRPQRAADILKKETESWRVAVFGSRIHVITDEDVESGIRTIAQKLEANGIRVIHSREERFSMEDVFISVVEQSRMKNASPS
jgi:ABC-2 type transport system ATP-binding protein